MSCDSALVEVVDLVLVGENGSGLNGVSVVFRRGVTALIGAEGAGKESLIGYLAGTLRSSSGSMIIQGLDSSSSSRGSCCPSSVGWAPRQLVVPAGMSVFDLLEYAARMHGMAGDERAQRVRDVAEHLDLIALLGLRVESLDDYANARLRVAVAVLHLPELVILEKLLQGLTYLESSMLLSMINTFLSDVAIIVSCLPFEDVPPEVRNIVVIEDGQVLFEGTRKEFVNLGHQALKADAVSPVVAALIGLRTLDAL